MPALPVSRSGAVTGDSAGRQVRFSGSPTIIGAPSENTGRSVPRRRKPHRSVDMQERLIDERRNRTSLLNQAHAIVIASELAEVVGRTDKWTIAVVGCGKKVFVRYPVGGAVECRNLL